MNNLFKDELGVSVYVYIDDIFIFSKTYKEHLAHIRNVLKKLRDNQFIASRSKSQFLPESLSILGHVITKNGIAPEPQKVSTILDWPTPQNKKEVLSFLGMANYLSQFCPHLATLAAPLSEIAGSTTAWDWTPLHDKAFQDIKDTIRAGAIIQPLDYEASEKDKPIYLITDASLVGTGAWVAQGPSLAELRPARFHSRKFNSAQEQYTVFDKELLAIVDALEHFRSMLSGCKFTILTDHKQLESFPQQRDLLGKHARWQSIIAGFDCTIKHIGGHTNVIADAFSRVFLNPSVLPSKSDFIPSKLDPPEHLNSYSTLLNAHLCLPSRNSTRSSPTIPSTDSSWPRTVVDESCPPTRSQAPHRPATIMAAASTRSQVRSRRTTPQTSLSTPQEASQIPGTASNTPRRSPRIQHDQQPSVTPRYASAPPAQQPTGPITSDVVEEDSPQLDQVLDSAQVIAAAKQRKEHVTKHWSACFDEYCPIHYSDHQMRTRRLPKQRCYWCGKPDHNHLSCTVKKMEQEAKRQQQIQQEYESTLIDSDEEEEDSEEESFATQLSPRPASHYQTSPSPPAAPGPSTAPGTDEAKENQPPMPPAPTPPFTPDSNLFPKYDYSKRDHYIKPRKGQAHSLVIGFNYKEGPTIQDGEFTIYTREKPNNFMIRDPPTLQHPHHAPFGHSTIFEYVNWDADEDIAEFLISEGVVMDKYPKLALNRENWLTPLMWGYEQDDFFRSCKRKAPYGGYTFAHGILYQSDNGKIRICIPDTKDCKKIKNEILEQVHSALGHGALDKTYHFMQHHFYWPSMRKDTALFCKTCPICQRTKSSNQRPYGLIKSLPLPYSPGTHLSMDFLMLPATQMTKDGLVYDHVLVIVDRFSKFTMIIPIPVNCSAEDFKRIFHNQVYGFWGMPCDIVTDKDARFTAQVWIDYCKRHGVHRSMSTPYHPTTDGQTEIVNKQILQIIRAKLQEAGHKWIDILGEVQMAINCSLDDTRQATPAAITLRFTPRLAGSIAVREDLEGRPDGLSDAIWKSVRGIMASKRVGGAEQANKKRKKAPEFRIGSLVMIKTDNLGMISAFPKLEPKQIGPYPIIEVYPETDNYTVKTPQHVHKGRVKVHVSQLQEWIPNPDDIFPTRKNLEPGPVPECEDEDEYEVDYILGHRQWADGSFSYLVKWKDWDVHHNSWVHETGMKDADMLQDYKRNVLDKLVSPSKRRRGYRKK
jgi:hypothetical protein